MKNMNLDNYHVIAYLRVSDKHQVDGDGFDRQRETIHGWLKSQQGEHRCLENYFLEKGFTGTDFDRPELGRLFEYCRTLPHDGFGRPILVLVERSDRLSRDNLTSELILREFKALDVMVVDCEADIDLMDETDPSRVLIRQMLQAIAQFDKSSIVQKLRKARERIRARGDRCEGAKPFGHFDEEKPALEMIYSLQDQGHSALQITQILNEGQVYRPRRGHVWNRGTIHRILKARPARD